MPGATETAFFERADMMDTSVGVAKKDDAAEVAKAGFDAMMRGEGDIVTRNEKQDPVGSRQYPAGGLLGQTASQAGRTGVRNGVGCPLPRGVW